MNEYELNSNTNSYLSHRIIDSFLKALANKTGVIFLLFVKNAIDYNTIHDFFQEGLQPVLIQRILIGLEAKQEIILLRTDKGLIIYVVAALCIKISCKFN